MQLESLNQQYEQAQQNQLMGASLGGPLFMEPMEGAPGASAPGAVDATQFGRSSLQDLAEKMAQSYGLQFGRGSLVDAQGNFMKTPDQLASLQAGSQGGDVGMGDVAAKMNYVAQAINDRRVEMEKNKAIASLQAGLGLVQSRGRGSLAALQSGFFQNMAQVYTDPNLLPEQQDFSYWIQRQQLEEAAALRSEDQVSSGGSGGSGYETKVSHGSGTKAPYGNTTNPISTDTIPTSSPSPTSGPNAGKTAKYLYDPISKSTTVYWE
jgi:hypothetical protein